MCTLLPRERTEQIEQQVLCGYAMLSRDTQGRQFPLEKCPLRTEFQRDRDRIIHSTSFRRLKHKTQVFLIPTGDHYRTRLTHTLEVSQIARTMARALALNEDLTEAIALGHDLGHTPFGHAGEQELNRLCPTGFRHYEQSLRTVDYIEKSGEGLNLTYEVRNGILAHTNMIAETREGQIVRTADVVAYINHDIDDSIRAGVLCEDEIPTAITDVLGNSKSARITTLVNAVVSHGAEQIGMADEIRTAHDALHRFMFDYVYRNPVCKSEEVKAKSMIAALYEYFCTHQDALPAEYLSLAEKFGTERAVCDYVAGMTDGYAIATFEALYIPKGWARI